MNPVILLWLLNQNSRGGRSRYSGSSPGDEGCLLAFVLIVLAALAIVGGIIWAVTPPSVLVAVDRVTVEIVRVDPPKHVYVDFKNVETGEVSRIGLGKHFSNWRKIEIGKRMTVTRHTYQQGESRYYSWPGLREELRATQ